MVQQILDDLRTYFEAKTTITPEEQALLQRLKDDFFPITSVSREDLQTYGFDTRSVTDAQMRRLAQKMANDYCEQLFWSSMEIIAEGLEFPRYPECPVCASRHVCLDGQKGTFRCEGCGQEWHEHLYVLVEFPDDTSFFEEEYIGYPSFGSSDNGARYVSEYDYIAHFKKQPESDRYFKPLGWPESQLYLFQDESNDDLYSLNEPIQDENGIEDFGENAVWVPLCNLKQ